MRSVLLVKSEMNEKSNFHAPQIASSRFTCIALSGYLLTAGEATITAEYQEGRPELAAIQKGKQAIIRAVALAVSIFPAAVQTLSLDSKPNSDRLTVTNAANKHQRTLLKAASLQVISSLIWLFCTSSLRLLLLQTHTCLDCETI